ncbi:hypothetical protein NMG60_11014419 [Bertholletia excelsa]
MLSGNTDFPDNSIEIKNDNHFSSRRLSQELSIPKSSTEVYYGGASIGVPFTWESQPGTPKVRFKECPLPPLTPPPSFHFSSNRKTVRKSSKQNLFHSVLPKLNLRKTKTSQPTSPPSSSSSSRSFSRSVPSSPYTPRNIPGQLSSSSPRLSSSDSRPEEDDEWGSPVSTLCFGILSRGANGRSRRCLSSMLKVLLRESP